MRNHQMTLVSDFYKQCHAEQYPEEMEYIVSYFTPRGSRLPQQELIVFGLQGFIKDYLIERFNETFFEVPFLEIKKEYERVISNTLTKDYIDITKIEKLHELGYLPIEISALEEGTFCPMGVPCIQVRNTIAGYAWLVQYIESIMSAQLWYPMTIANQAYLYRTIVEDAYEKTVTNAPVNSAISEFGFRGAEGQEGSILASCGFLTSFSKTSTIPAILYLEDYYNADISDGKIASGMISTEHSVMCSNYAVDGDEKTFIKKLLTEIYPTGNISIVSDSYNYWNFLQNIICSREIRNIIKNREGTVFVRGDSGDPADIVCGDPKEKEFSNENLGTVDILFNYYGGTLNDKGFKVLDSHIKAIYGDGITPSRAMSIYKRLEEKGYAANNIALGAGSFSMQCLDTPNGFSPFTRDSYGIAIKATFAIINKKPIMIFKDPKTDKDKIKKSQKGICSVYLEDNKIVYKDGLTKFNRNSLLLPVFVNSKMTKETSLDEIRNKIHKNNF